MAKHLLSLAVVAMLSTTANASNIYHFLEENTNSVLATIEFSSLPASHTEVIQFALTSDGQAIFGYGPTDSFDIDFSLYLVTDDMAGGLGGDAPFQMIGVLADSQPPTSSFHGAFGTETWQMIFGTVDTLELFPTNLDGNPTGPFVRARGDWRRVPEPSTVCALVGLSIAGLGFRQRRRKRS